MASTCKIYKDSVKPKFSTQHRNRCKLCGRPRAVYRKFHHSRQDEDKALDPWHGLVS